MGITLTQFAGPATDADVQWVEVGVVRMPHGVRGEVKVQPLTDFPEDRLAEPGVRSATLHSMDCSGTFRHGHCLLRWNSPHC